MFIYKTWFKIKKFKFFLLYFFLILFTHCSIDIIKTNQEDSNIIENETKCPNGALNFPSCNECKNNFHLDSNNICVPNDSENNPTQNIINYFKSLPNKTNKKVLSGQSFSYSISQNQYEYDKYITSVETATNKKISIIGSDLVFGSKSGPTNWANEILTEHWNAGGIVTLSWHAFNPVTLGDSFDRSISFSNITVEGTSEYIAWKSRLDLAAKVLSDLNTKGVVVLWRPFHEMQGGWFWWGNRDPNDFKKAWKYMHKYFTETYNLDNLVWVYSTSRTGGAQNQLSFYPGDSYVDIVGMSYYSTNFEASFADYYNELKTTQKPFAITELGLGAKGGGPVDYSQIITGIKNHLPDTVFFFCWHNEWAMIENNNIQTLLDDPWIAHRNEINLDN